jgi:hypothetical protein
MYDNIDFRLRKNDVSNIDFLSETPCFFEITGTHDFKGEPVIMGKLDNFRISVNRGGVNIKDGSLCKWYLGDNFQSLERRDVKFAIEKLSDILHLPMGEATISRLDIACNFIVKQPVQVYYNHLGELKHGGRAPVTNGAGMCETLYYYKAGGLLVFYDKVKEQKEKGQIIPELYQNSNVLRYEQRYKSRLSKVFNVERVTGEMLYNEKFYIDVINRWRDNYRGIKKINDISLNFEAMKGKKDLYTMGLLSLIEQQGGELAMIVQINEAYKTGKLTRRQADEMKLATREVCKMKTGIMVQNDAILELDKKVNEAVKFYR